MKRLSTCILLLAMAICASGQTLTGKVTDEQQQPLSYANVVFLSLPDSAFVAGAVSGEDGSFSLSAEGGKGVLKVSCIGYTTLYKECGPGELLSLQLKADAQLLDEVVVKGDLPKTRLKNGASITNVAGTILEKAGTAENLLDRIPGVSAGGGAVSVFGRGAAEVYINGRKVRDSSELDQLASDNIKSVEVINNPGARYAASVKAVVRITTKRAPGEGFGFNNRLLGQYQYDWTVLDQFNFNYRSGGFDLSGMLFGSNDRDEYFKTVRQDTYLDKTWTQHSDLSNRSHSQHLEGMLSLNWQVNPAHALGVRYNYKRTPKSASDLSMHTDVLLDGEAYEQAENTNASDARQTDHRLNLYYNGTVGGWNVDFNADGLWNENKGRSLGREYTRTLELPEEARDITTFDESRNTLYAAKLVVSHALAGGQFAVGSEYTRNNRTSLYDNREGILQGEDDEVKEEMWAVFGEYSRQLGQGSVQAGVRYEHLKSDYYEYGVFNKEQSRKYSNVFPSLSLSHPIGQVQLQLSYAADITRPDYSLLNSAPRYVNRYTYEAGNPLLQPTLSHNLTLDVAWKQLYFSGGYRHIKDGMTSFCDSYSADNPAISLLRPVNIEDFDKAYAMVAYSPKFGCWQPQWVASMEQQWYKGSTPEGSRMFNHPLGSFLWKNSLELPWDILMYVDATVITQGHSENVHNDKTQWRLDASLYREFAGKRLSCLLSVTDLFSTMTNHVTAYSGIRTLTMGTDTRRTFTVTLRYKFNATKSKYKGTGAGSSQKNRM